MNLYYILVLAADNSCVEKVGGDEEAVLAVLEPTLKYHPCVICFLTVTREAGHGTVLGG